MGGAGRARLPWFHHDSAWGGGRLWQAGGMLGSTRKEEKKLPSPAARPGEGERGTVSFKTTLFCTFFFLHATASFYEKRAISFKGGANILFSN
jgi:hypothetical protein